MYSCEIVKFPDGRNSIFGFSNDSFCHAESITGIVIVVISSITQLKCPKSPFSNPKRRHIYCQNKSLL